MRCHQDFDRFPPFSTYSHCFLIVLFALGIIRLSLRPISLVAVEELQALGRCLRLGQRRLHRSMMSRISVALVLALGCFGYIWVQVII